MPTRNINLTDHLDHFIKRQVASGRYSNVSEIVRAALRVLEAQEQEQQAKLQALRHAAKLGFEEIDQGRGIMVKGRNGLGRFFEAIQAEVRGKAARKGR